MLSTGKLPKFRRHSHLWDPPNLFPLSPALLHPSPPSSAGFLFLLNTSSSLPWSKPSAVPSAWDDLLLPPHSYLSLNLHIPVQKLPPPNFLGWWKCPKFELAMFTQLHKTSKLTIYTFNGWNLCYLSYTSIKLSHVFFFKVTSSDASLPTLTYLIFHHIPLPSSQHQSRPGISCLHSISSPAECWLQEGSHLPGFFP